MEIVADSSQLLVYLGILLGPFIQEDAAVLAAATLSATDMAHTVPILIAIYIGLFLSDIWKYWIGWAALRNDRARAFTERKHVADMKDKVQRYTLTTLLTARFVPLARIPAYVACGFFSVSYPKFCLYIAFTAFLYVAVIFTACHLLGTILGEKLMWVMPIVAGGVIISVFGTAFVLRRKKQTNQLGNGK